MSQYFTEANAGERYALYRPKVHDVALKWLEQVTPGRRFSRAVDVACGTGDSTVPLMKIADEVLGVDASDEMLGMAKRQGIKAIKAQYSELNVYGKFDLISTCMAFHWFNVDTAISAYKAASNQDAIWLIYNFAFGGHSSSDLFNDWFWKTYLKEYPSPPRGKMSDAIPPGDPEVQLLAKDSGWLPIEFTKEQLLGYLSTQSNIENQLRQGNTLEQIQSVISRQIDGISMSGHFKYTYTYAIYQFKRSQQDAQPDALGAG